MKKIYTQKIDSSEKEVNVIPLLKVLLKRWWIIILTGLIVGGATFAVTKIFINQTYRCGFTAFVNNKQVKQTTDILTSSDVTAAKELVRTYSHILKSDTVLSSAAESIKLNLKYADLSNMVYTEIQDETEIIAVYVVDENPLVAYDLAQAIAKVAPSHMADIVEGSSMKIIDNPQYNEKRYKPSYIRFSIVGFIVGALIVVVLIMIRYLKDDTINNEGELENQFSIPLLGVIPNIEKASEKRTNYYDYNYYESKENSEKSGSVNEEK